MKTILIAFAGVAAIPAIRAALKSYRAHKKAGEILADAVEAAVDAVDKSE